MPFYEVYCERCGYGEEYSKIDARNNIKCSECTLNVERLISPVTTIGIVWDKKVSISQIGRTFNSNAEMRQYEKENPGFTFMTRDSPEWRAKRDRSRARVEKLAQRSGFKDWDDMQKKNRAEKKKKTEKALSGS